MARKLVMYERRQADALIAPILPRYSSLTAPTIAALVEAGEAAATSALPTLQEVFRRA